jgi:hypothetical protein
MKGKFSEDTKILKENEIKILEMKNSKANS